ncbi:MAG TPA: PVC-type heme-binding CxxCH protein [Chthoniobacteraceae bacterium]|nr:PVC-type heme-binding CxxCH protein [Chthoniobacteraceae bacterium]
MSIRPLSILAAALLGLTPFAGADDFPALYNSEKGGPGAPNPPSPEEALKTLTLPPGFSATMWAHEPDVQNPIGMAWDARGRMWVAENYTYAERKLRFDLGLRDRVTILEDKDGDGVAETRKVFTDQVQMLTSVEVGRGGVWLMCPPQLLFIPDANGDDVPDGPPQVVLDGFTVAKDNYHNFANGLRWGPDGWLYGRCGGSCPGLLGTPGTPDEQRIPMRGGMWRYHPGRKVVEVICHGTTNPWGHDWDQFGELFFVNTVGGHLWHALPGAHFGRSHTLDPNPNAYGTIDQHADHYHFDTGKGWQASRNGAANDLGGGHAHCGTMIYQGTEWPKEYWNKLLTLNFHGRRANVERLDREGSAIIGKHEPDVFLFGDPWFRPIDISQGPDGAAYVLDWSDYGECHDSDGVHRTSGRIYKIKYGTEKPAPLPELEEANEDHLAGMLADPNVWRARAAQRVLEDRAAAGVIREHLPESALNVLLGTAKDPAVRLRAMLTLHSLGVIPDEDSLRQHLQDQDEHIRGWCIRLLTENFPLDTIYGPLPGQPEVKFPLAAEFAHMAREDTSPMVRSVLASTLQRMPVPLRAEVAKGLVTRTEEATDHDLPAMVWYGLMPVGDRDPAALVPVAEAGNWPNLVTWISRRIALASEKTPEAFEALLAMAVNKPATFQTNVVEGASEAFKGWRKAVKPKSWDALVAKLEPRADEATKGRLRDLSTLFGDGRALEEVKRVALDEQATVPVREAALRTLIEARPPDLRAICEKLLAARYLNVTAARGLTLFDDPAIGDLIAKNYRNFQSTDRPAVVEAMSSRVPWALALLDMVEKGTMERGNVSAFHARQMRNLNDSKLNARLTEVWGDMRETAADKKALMEKTRALFPSSKTATGDASKGRQIFTQTCAVCHTLFGEGAKIGPDLTGANRDNLDYLLENIIDPSAVIAADFRATVLTLKDGRVLFGMVTANNERTITFRTITESVAIERADIAKNEVQNISMMPEGLLTAYTPEQVKDLFAYLMSRNQVPLPAAK